MWRLLFGNFTCIWGTTPNLDTVKGLTVETLQFYDVTEIPDRVFDTIKGDITGTPGNILVIKNVLDYDDTPLTIENAEKNGLILSVAKGASGDGPEISLSDKYVENYTLCGEDNDTIFLWLSDDCAKVNMQSDGIEAVYLSGGTMFSIVSDGNAEMTFDPDAASASYQAEEDAEIELTVQRNSNSEKDWMSAEITTDLNADGKVTLTLREDGIPQISGPAGQKYDVSTKTDHSGSGIPNATVEEVMEFFGEEPTPSFSDVSTSAYYYDAVQWAVEQGITTGTSARTFSPDEPCTRAQVVTFIWRALGLDDLSSRSTENPFRDVPSGAYYRDPVLWAAENGITTGTSATTFSPDDACTRAQVVTFLWRTDYPPKKISGPVGFRDVHIEDYFWFPVKWALEREITTGTSADTFSPHQTCTRAEVVTFLYRDFA